MRDTRMVGSCIEISFVFGGKKMAPVCQKRWHIICLNVCGYHWKTQIKLYMYNLECTRAVSSAMSGRALHATSSDVYAYAVFFVPVVGNLIAIPPMDVVGQFTSLIFSFLCVQLIFLLLKI